MKTFKLFILSALVFVTSASAEEWKVSGAQLSGKKSPAITIKSDKPKLIVQPSVSGDKISINLSDGKSKFGMPAIIIKNGENVYARARLDLVVQMSDVTTVTADAPLVVANFTQSGSNYEVKFVHSGKSKLPDLIILKK